MALATEAKAAPESNDENQSHNKYKINISNEEKAALVELRAAVNGIKNLYCRLDDEFLIKFLRAKNLKVKKATKLVEYYYTQKFEKEHLFDTPISTYIEILNQKGVVVLKNRDELGRRIVYVRLRLFDFDQFTLDEMSISIVLIIEELVKSEETQKKGIVFINDYRDLTFAQVKSCISHCTLKEVQRSVNFFQGGFPAKFKASYILNTPVVFSSIWAMGKYLLTKKIRKRIFISSTSSGIISKHFDLNTLPECIGGKLTLEEATDMEVFESIASNEAYYQDQSKYGFKL